MFEKMNLKEAILREHSKTNSVAIANWIGSDKKRFAELMTLFINGEYRVTQRAAWILQFCAENDMELIKPYIGNLLDNLKNNKVHDAVKRNTMRIFQNLDIPKKHQGQTAEICFQYLQSQTEAIAIKCFAMTVIANVCKTEPELKSELKLLVEAQYLYSSAGFQSRAKRTFKNLKIETDLF